MRKESCSVADESLKYERSRTELKKLSLNAEYETDTRVVFKQKIEIIVYMHRSAAALKPLTGE